MSALEVRDLSKRFPIGGALRRSHVHAVEDVSFELRPGTITALVGGRLVARPERAEASA